MVINKDCRVFIILKNKESRTIIASIRKQSYQIILYGRLFSFADFKLRKFFT